ncbi:MAG: SdiA-regulated domain-containing protein [Myxococcaceae bacterium]|nr:SdiA-regulated domain-containing protein [Myxococcaceae bacterium]
MPRVQGWGTVARRLTTDAGAARFEAAERLATRVKEASDVVALPSGGFAVVGDRTDRLTFIDARGAARTIELPGLENGRSQLEGVAYDPNRKHLCVARGESRQILRYEWDPSSDERPKLEKTFEAPSPADNPKNKGIEGLVYLDGRHSPTGRPQLLLATEGKPRRLSLVDDGGGGKPADVKLEREVLAVCRDFSALAVDPKTGHVFVSSDESATVAEVALERRGGDVRCRLVQSFALRTAKGTPLKRVEGLTFDAKGDLFVLTENDGELRRLARR